MGIRCCAMLILCLNHIGELQLFFLFYSLSSFSTFSVYMFVTLTVLFLVLGASIVCVNNLKRTADLVLWFPDRTSVFTHPWLDAYKYNLIVLKVSWNPTKPGIKFSILHNCWIDYVSTGFSRVCQLRKFSFRSWTWKTFNFGGFKMCNFQTKHILGDQWLYNISLLPWLNVYQVKKIKYSYCVLRDHKEYGFILPCTNFIPSQPSLIK